jgi:hypothetical protein
VCLSGLWPKAYAIFPSHSTGYSSVGLDLPHWAGTTIDILFLAGCTLGVYLVNRRMSDESG